MPPADAKAPFWSDQGAGVGGRTAACHWQCNTPLCQAPPLHHCATQGHAPPKQVGLPLRNPVQPSPHHLQAMSRTPEDIDNEQCAESCSRESSQLKERDRETLNPLTVSILRLYLHCRRLSSKGFRDQEAEGVRPRGVNRCRNISSSGWGSRNSLQFFCLWRRAGCIFHPCGLPPGKKAANQGAIEATEPIIVGL